LSGICREFGKETLAREKAVGYSYAHDIEKAGLFLLGLLLREGSVRYSRFYDGTDETQTQLLRGMGYPEEGEDFEPDNPETLMDLAAGELSDGGIVKITFLSEKLSDDEPDYLIELTEKGRSFVEGGGRFEFWDAE
jgi:hypothetical protein